MTPRSELADIEWLTGSEAGAILAELAEDSGPLHAATTRLRKSLSPARTHVVLEQVELRRRATAKFAHAQQLFFTRLGLEQATDEWVARHKAQRFAHRPVADLCCGIGGDLMALASARTAIGVDRDPVAAHFAAVNTGVPIGTIDVVDFDFNGAAAWHIDPDRRASGHRTVSLEYCQPTLATIERFLTRVPHAGIKLAPATSPPADWIDRSELEWISRDGECKQLVAWHGNLALSPGERRAAVLTTNDRKPLRTVIGQPGQPPSLVSKPDRYVFDVDPAVVAARLTGRLAAEHGLSALGAGPTYLTGSRTNDDGALACFEVEGVFPMRVNKLAQHLAARGIGRLEIKKRGTVIDIDKLHGELKLRGSNAATLLITQIADRPAAILAHRLPT
jgi:hypothetical protein